MLELGEGIRRVTLPLPFGLDHVHCYLLPTSNGFTLVDTGLGTRDPEARWRPVLDALDAPVERIVVTHMHPDHVGGARDVAALTGAPVVQGREDYAQCLDAWGPGRSPTRMAAHWVANGMPESVVGSVVAESSRLADAIHWAESPQLVEPGDEIDGWRVELLRGHADGHIVLVRDGVLIAGDTILSGITPTIGLYPNARPDPLGDYLVTLERIEQLAPRIAYAGHKDVILDPAGRAREIRAHHEERLEATAAALDGDPRTAYDVSLVLFVQALSAVERRFAVAESLAHLERLVSSGEAERDGGGYVRA
ncbi:MAG TPA: MBL fold metallo-hydrolase [Gaiellaceae bacterium]|jgi:glyoxylase-like metal-dependent hydrolase (beta-lactamase superfamily II)